MPGGIHPPKEVLIAWSKKPHFVETRGWDLTVLVIVLSSITLLTICARLWARFIVRRNVGLDDAVLVAAMVPTLGLAVAIILASRKFGFDRHAWDLTPPVAVQSRKVTMAIEALYIASTGLTKISILLFYRRMTDGVVSTFFRFAVKSCIFFVIAYIVTFLLTLFLGCHPIGSFWNQVSLTWAATHAEGKDFHCFSEPANLLAASGISVVQDFIACGMPMLLFSKLQMPMRTKIALAAIFGIGFFLCITGVLRIYYIYNLFYRTYDVTWACEAVWAWTAVESHIAIICASAPALKVFFKAYMTFPLVPSSIMASWRQREYQRRGYTQDKKSSGSGQGTKVSRGFFNVSKKSKETSDATDSSGTKVDNALASNGTRADIEMGGIEVRQEVNVDSESRPRTEESFLTNESVGSTDGLQKTHVRQLKSFDTPWLGREPSGEPKGSSVASCHHSSWTKAAPAVPVAALTRGPGNAEPAWEADTTSAMRKLIPGRKSSAGKARASEETQRRNTELKSNVKYMIAQKG